MKFDLNLSGLCIEFTIFNKTYHIFLSSGNHITKHWVNIFK